MEVKAKYRHASISPQKLRLVCDQVRGMDVQQARAVLEHIPHKGAGIIQKTLASAVANATNNFSLSPDDLYVAQIFADEGPRLKRFKAGARGRYKPRVRRTAHLTVILSEREGA
jgi:large subunit ribosomal protein L22